MRAAIKGPFTLGHVDPASTEHGNGGDVVELNAANHGAIATIVWRMEDDESTQELEEFAHHVVKALNAHDKLVAALTKARDLCASGGAMREDFFELDEALALASGQVQPTAALPTPSLKSALRDAGGDPLKIVGAFDGVASSMNALALTGSAQ